MSEIVNSVKPKANPLQELKSIINKKDITDYDRLEFYMREFQSGHEIFIQNKKNLKEYIERIYIYAKKRYIDDPNKINEILATLDDAYDIQRVTNVQNQLDNINKIKKLNRDEVELINEFQAESSSILENAQNDLINIQKETKNKDKLTQEIYNKIEEVKNRKVESYLTGIENELLECLSLIDVLLEYDQNDFNEEHFTIKGFIKKLKGDQ